MCMYNFTHTSAVYQAPKHPSWMQVKAPYQMIKGSGDPKVEGDSGGSSGKVPQLYLKVSFLFKNA